jgi:hypothetical protein
MIESSTLVCKYENCNLIYEDPVALPCGNSLCKKHLYKQVKAFKCYFCQNEHEIPEIGFTINETMIKMIDSHFNETNPLRKMIKETFNILNESIGNYEKIDQDVYIYDYFAEIRNKVDLHREELIKEINEKSDEIIKLLKEKEDKCKLNSKNIEKMNLKKLKDYELAK